MRSNLIPAYFFAGNKILDLFCRSERQAEVVFTSQPQGSWRGVQGLPLPLPPSRLLQQIRGQGKVQVLHSERKAGRDQGHGESKGLQVCTGGCLVSTVQLYLDLGFFEFRAHPVFYHLSAAIAHDMVFFLETDLSPSSSAIYVSLTYFRISKKIDVVLKYLYSVSGHVITDHRYHNRYFLFDRAKTGVSRSSSAATSSWTKPTVCCRMTSWRSSARSQW